MLTLRLKCAMIDYNKGIQMEIQFRTMVLVVYFGVILACVCAISRALGV